MQKLRQINNISLLLYLLRTYVCVLTFVTQTYYPKNNTPYKLVVLGKVFSSMFVSPDNEPGSVFLTSCDDGSFIT